MEIIKTVISACGGALVAGLFGMIAASRSTKRERERENKTILDKLNELDNKLIAHIARDAEAKADEARGRILRFGDEVRLGVEHTEEHWNDILRDVDNYEEYCREHERYENNRAVHTIMRLKEVYDDRLKKNDFLN